jgi:hypothetical protein
LKKPGKNRAAAWRNNMQSLSTELTFKDKFGGVPVRLGFMRMNYRAAPGLYTIGQPDKNSPVLVTANYKLTVDAVRKELSGIAAFILVLDTKGVNVWCAAGKGTFGTAELINRMESTELKKHTDNRTLILPQLGAPGIAAYQVTKKTGFKVVYGPVYARDLKAFLKNSLIKTVKMSTVDFGLIERLKVIPLEVMQTWKFLLPALAVSLLIPFIEGASPSTGLGIWFLPLLAAVITGCVAVPLALPFIPFRAFSVKGAIAGLVLSVLLFFYTKVQTIDKITYFFLLPAVSAYLSLNFTGASTFTSLSGVKKEVRIALPAVIISLASGAVIKTLDLLSIL